MEISRGYVIGRPIVLHRLTWPKGEHPHQWKLPSMYSRLQSVHNNLRPTVPFILMRNGWHNSVDEPRAPGPGRVRFEG